jgi:ribosomal protein S27AE
MNTTKKRRCPNCGKVVIGHPNKKFCKQKCRDRYHNDRNPRGFFSHLNQNSPDYYADDDTHPFDSDALGQD